VFLLALFSKLSAKFLAKRRQTAEKFGTFFVSFVLVQKSGLLAAVKSSSG
jgi:hypothetical protein